MYLANTKRTVCDAAVVIAKCMEKNHHEMQSKRVLELGAGTGLAGLAAAALGALVDISDLGYCIPSIATNIQHTNLMQSNRTTGIATARTLDGQRQRLTPTMTRTTSCWALTLYGWNIWWVHWCLSWNNCFPSMPV